MRRRGECEDATTGLEIEQIYSVMQTSTQRGMQTMEHGLAELIRKGVVTVEVALAASSRHIAGR